MVERPRHRKHILKEVLLIAKKLDLKVHITIRHLADSIGVACTSWSWGCAFKPHVRYTDYLKTKSLKNK